VPVVTDDLRDGVVERLGELLGDGIVDHVVVPGRDLTVRVTDATGRPVQGATVEFSAWSGGGSLLTPDAERLPVLTATTDRLGLASAPLLLGTDTGVDPVYVRRELEGISATRAGANLVEAVAVSRQGDLVLDEPFVAYAYPGRPEVLRRTDTDQTAFTGGAAGSWVDTVFLAVEDRYGNPVANESLHFRTEVVATDDTCANAPVEPIDPGAVFRTAECNVAVPRLGDCGAPELDRATRTDGLTVGVMLGDSAVSLYRLTVEHPSLPPLSFAVG